MNYAKSNVAARLTYACAHVPHLHQLESIDLICNSKVSECYWWHKDCKLHEQQAQQCSSGAAYALNRLTPLRFL